MGYGDITIFLQFIGVSAASDNTAITMIKLIIIFAGFFGPFLLIPKTFQLGGSAFSSLTGMVNNSTKDTFGRLKNAKTNARAKNAKDMLNGTRFSGRNALSRRFNAVTGGLGTGVKGRFGLGERGAAATSANLREAATEKMKDPKFQQVQYDDNAMRAATYESAAAAKAAGIDEDSIRKVQSTIGFGRAQQLAASQQMLLNKTAYRDSADVARTIARVSGGNNDVAESLRGFNNAYAKQVGRHDLSAVSTDAVGHANAMYQAGQNADEAPLSMELAAESRANTIRGFDNADTYTLGRENATSYGNFADTLSDEYEAAVTAYRRPGGRTTMNRDAVIEARTKLEELVKNSSSATGGNARIATQTADRIAGADEALRSIGDGDEILRSTAGTVGYGGLARTTGQQSPAERSAGEGGSPPVPPGTES